MRPEHAFLLALATVDPSPTALAAARSALRNPGFSWPAASDLAAQNRVLAAIAANVLCHDDLRRAAGPVVEAQFRLATTAVRIRLGAIADALRPIVMRWNADGIPWALLKGAALIAAVYPPHRRLLNDVDILIAPGDYSRARAAMTDNGFTPVTGVHSEEAWLAMKSQVPFRRLCATEPAATVIDLHVQVYAPAKPFTLDAAGTLSRRRPALFESLPVNVVDPIDLTLHLATQLLNDRLCTQLLRLTDLEALFAQVDPGECDRRAAATNSTAALAFARAAVARLFADRALRLVGTNPVDRRASTIAEALVARGWPWAESVDLLPETYRQAATDVLQHGAKGAVVACLRRAGDYRRDRRRSGASWLRSALGGLRMAAAGTCAVARVWREMDFAPLRPSKSPLR